MFVATCLYLVVTVVTCLIMYIVLKKRRLNRLTANIKTFSGELPIIGNTIKVYSVMSNDLLDLFHALNDETENGVVKFWLGAKLMFSLTNPNVIKTFLNQCVDKSVFYKFGTPLFGDGLILSGGAKWKHHRRTMNPMFHENILDDFLPIFNQTAVVLVDQLKERDGKSEFDHSPYLSANALATTSRLILGMPIEDQIINDTTFGKALDDFIETLNQRVRNFFMYPGFIHNYTENKKRADEHASTLRSFSKHAYNAKRCRNHNSNNVPVDTATNSYIPFLDKLLSAEDEGHFNEKDVMDEVDNITVAGYDTTYTALVYALALIGSYPEVQEKLFNELQVVFGESLRDVSKNDLSKLVYMEAAIKEVLRLFPAIPAIARKVVKEMKIDDLFFPEGSEVIIFLYGLHRNKAWGDDAHMFNPERFLSKDHESKISKMYFPFSFGKRNCIGKPYAMMSMKVILSHVLRKFKVKGNVDLIKVSYEVILKPKSGFKISLESRKKK